MGNQLNMMNINENVIINQNNKDSIINELSQGFGPKISFIFKDTSGPTISINANYGTTIRQLLLNYFKRIGMPDIMRSNGCDCVEFVLNGQTLKVYQQTKIENINLLGGPTPKIIVSWVLNLKEIKFKTTSNLIYTIFIISSSTVKNLLKLYLQKVNQPNLFGKSDKICFIHNFFIITYFIENKN